MGLYFFKHISQPLMLINAIFLHVAIKQAFKIKAGITDRRIASAFEKKGFKYLLKNLGGSPKGICVRLKNGSELRGIASSHTTLHGNTMLFGSM